MRSILLKCDIHSLYSSCDIGANAAYNFAANSIILSKFGAKICQLISIRSHSFHNFIHNDSNYFIQSIPIGAKSLLGDVRVEFVFNGVNVVLFVLLFMYYWS